MTNLRTELSNCLSLLRARQRGKYEARYTRVPLSFSGGLESTHSRTRNSHFPDLQSATTTLTSTHPMLIQQLQVEIGTKNHEVVPTPLISQLSRLQTGSNGANKSISTLAKANLIAKVKNAKYDGYRLTYGGLDYLALHAHTKSSSVLSLGSQMGVGKESDIYLITAPAAANTGVVTANLTPSTSPLQAPLPVQSILKIHRLGRTSFRSLARNRDYLRGRQHASWQYLSRLSAQKEFAAMTALYHAGFPVPRPIAWNRHTVVMSLVPGVPLRQVGIEAFGNVKEERDEKISELYEAIMELALRMAEVGCIHGDFNEFNILIENVPETAEMPEDEDENEADTMPGNEVEADPHSNGKAKAEADTSPPNPPRQTTPTPSNPSPNPNPHPPASNKPLIPHLIDFPQITSLSHPQAQSYFERDILCIKTFFQRKYAFSATNSGPTFSDAMSRLREAERKRALTISTSKTSADSANGVGVGIGVEVDFPDTASLASVATTATATTATATTRTSRHRNRHQDRKIWASKRLDVQIEAAGFSKKMARELEGYYEQDRGEEGEDGDGDGLDAEPAMDELSPGVDDLRIEDGDESDARENEPEVPEHDVSEENPDPWDKVGPRRIADDDRDNLSARLPSVTASRRPHTKPKAAAGWSI